MNTLVKHNPSREFHPPELRLPVLSLNLCVCVFLLQAMAQRG